MWLIFLLPLCWAEDACPRLAYCSVYVQKADLCNAWCANLGCGCYEGTLLTKTCYCTSDTCREVAYRCTCSCGQSCSIPSYDTCLHPATNERDCESQCSSAEYVFIKKGNNSICTCRFCQSMSTDDSFPRTNTSVFVPHSNLTNSSSSFIIVPRLSLNLTVEHITAPFIYPIVKPVPTPSLDPIAEPMSPSAIVVSVLSGGKETITDDDVLIICQASLCMSIVLFQLFQ